MSKRGPSTTNAAANPIEEAHRAILEQIVVGAALPRTLHEVCLIVEATLDGALASVLLLDQNTKTMRFGGAPSLADEYMDALEGLPIAATAGTCGTAMHFGVRVVTADILEDPKWAPYQALAATHALRACWSQPFSARDGRVLGTFAIYFQQPRQPSDVELDVLERAAKLVGLAVQRAETETILHNTEERLFHAQKMEALGQLAGGIAHDFNNLLLVMLSSASMLEDAVSPADGEARQDLALIRDAGGRAAGLIRQLLAFSRRQEWSPAPVRLDQVIARLKRLLSRTLGTRVELEADCSPVPTVWIDQGQLEQVLVNLAVNARDAMPNGGSFGLSTRPAQRDDIDGVLLEATDTGTGMSQDTIRRVFEPFFTTKAAGRGTGLGLATAFGIIERAKGSIEVASTLGVGTTFQIWLPACEADAERSLSIPPARRVRAHSCHSILVVDDDSLVRSMVGRLLRRQGYEVVEVCSGDEALAVLSLRGFDAVLSDVVMPGLTGGELLRRIRERWPLLPVLLMSGYTDDLASLREALRDGEAILQKPFSVAELTERVSHAIETRHGRSR